MELQSKRRRLQARSSTALREYFLQLQRRLSIQCIGLHAQSTLAPVRLCQCAIFYSQIQWSHGDFEVLRCMEHEDRLLLMKKNEYGFEGHVILTRRSNSPETIASTVQWFPCLFLPFLF